MIRIFSLPYSHIRSLNGNVTALESILVFIVAPNEASRRHERINNVWRPQSSTRVDSGAVSGILSGILSIGLRRHEPITFNIKHDKPKTFLHCSF